MAKQDKKKRNFFKKLKKYIAPSVLSIILIILSIITYERILSDKYYPLTFTGDTNISFLTEGQAIRKLQAKFDLRTKQKLKVMYGSNLFEVDLATSSAKLNYQALDFGFDLGRSGSAWNQIKTQLQTLILTNKITPQVTLSLDKQMDKIASAIDKPYQDATLIFDETNTAEGSPSAHIQTKESVDGLTLDKESLKQNITQFILTGKYQTELPTKTVPPKLTTNHILKAKKALEDILKEEVKLIFESRSWIIDTKQLLTLLDLTGGKSLLDENKTKSFLENIAKEIDQEVQEGLFEFNPATRKVSSFKQSQEGRKVDIDKTFSLLTDSLAGGSKIINLPVDKVSPKIQTSDVNSLGIQELIGRGVSNFAGSIANRIYNVNLTASKLNGVLIPPGEIFSFNQTVGDITSATGFKQAYVIKEGRTVLDDGGGVCQDSTTLFRAVLNAGLPVIKRTAHAYRVGYYEQGFPPGLDATVYYPSVDFQFKNDTQYHILIQAYTSGFTLYVDLYGTSDGRVSSISKSIVADQTPPPTELRQDDPTLPKGTVKQVDFPAWGAKVSFQRTVTRNGEQLIKETWNSSYKAWQAVYLVGTKE